jgi:YVTN family beta-propeller protein
MYRRAFLQSGLALAALGSPAQAATAAGHILVVDSVGASLDFIDNRSFLRVGRVPLDPRPRELALSPSGTLAYVSIYGPGIYGNNPTPGREITVIDVATMKFAKRISLGPHVAPHGLGVAPDGRLWVTCEAEGSLLLVDPSATKRSKTVAAIVPLGVKGPHRLAITPDGAKVYATSMSNPVLSVVDAHERRLIREIKTPKGLDGLAIAPDGRRLFAAALDRPSLWVIDVREDRAVREFPLDEPATRLDTIEGGLMVAHEQSGTVEVFDIPSMRRRGSAKVGKSPSGMAASPDGKVGYIASWAAGTITLVDLATLRTIRTVDVGGGPDGLALRGV